VHPVHYEYIARMKILPSPVQPSNSNLAEKADHIYV